MKILIRFLQKIKQDLHEKWLELAAPPASGTQALDTYNAINVRRKDLHQRLQTQQPQ